MKQLKKINLLFLLLILINKAAFSMDAMTVGKPATTAATTTSAILVKSSQLSDKEQEAKELINKPFNKIYPYPYFAVCALGRRPDLLELNPVVLAGFFKEKYQNIDFCRTQPDPENLDLAAYYPTALIRASEFKFPNLVSALLMAGANPNFILNIGKHTYGNTTALTTAITDEIQDPNTSEKIKETVKLLLEYNADPNLANLENVTPLMITIEEIYTHIRRLDYYTEKNFGLAKRTAENGIKNLSKVAIMLCKHGANINMPSNLYACKKETSPVDYVEQLLQKPDTPFIIDKLNALKKLLLANSETKK